ncbi:MAG: YbhB/YbcL family Raf kinase inhibitor-like protein [Rhodoferax sp.]|uniref:YbhB/YbcL family Raf kinase inhibitor-like protein n=1 Tax=Rhodoferax sp. TaxID=50421 RepID=UPI003016E9EA
MSLNLSSSSFMHAGMIPARHTCDGVDHSPSLAWAGEPDRTKTFVLIMEDPDAPDPRAPIMTWAHWLLYNLPGSTHDLPAGVVSSNLPTGTLEGVNDWKNTGYGGPCPPIGRHRYFFKLYALDVRLPDLKKPNKQMLEQAMQGHVLAQAELMGLYQRRL